MLEIENVSHRWLTPILQYNTNLYRPGGLNLPIRMNNILGSASSFDFVEIITWVISFP